MLSGAIHNRVTATVMNWVGYEYILYVSRIGKTRALKQVMITTFSSGMRSISHTAIGEEMATCISNLLQRKRKYFSRSKVGSPSQNAPTNDIYNAKEADVFGVCVMT